jgi:hypothetical protein
MEMPSDINESRLAAIVAFAEDAIIRKDLDGPMSCGRRSMRLSDTFG